MEMQRIPEGNAHMPRLSIITISLNCKDVIEKTILSVIDQSYANVEYIIVDGGSDDGTKEIIQKYDRRISKWVSENDRGISDAMNKGIEMATGDVIGIIHAGDWYESQCFASVAAQYRSDSVHVFYGDVRFHSPRHPPLVVSTDASYLLLKMSVAHPGVFITKRAYQEFGAYNENYKLAMDYELLLRMFKAGAYFKKIPGVVANFLEDGISSKRWKRALTECLKIKNKYSQSKIERVINYIFYSWILMGNFYKRLKMLRYK